MFRSWRLTLLPTLCTFVIKISSHYFIGKWLTLMVCTLSVQEGRNSGMHIWQVDLSLYLIFSFGWPIKPHNQVEITHQNEKALRKEILPTMVVSYICGEFDIILDLTQHSFPTLMASWGLYNLSSKSRAKIWWYACFTVAGTLSVPHIQLYPLMQASSSGEQPDIATQPMHKLITREGLKAYYGKAEALRVQAWV